MTTKAQRAADRVFLRALDRWLGDLERSEQVSRSVHNRIAERLSRELRGRPSSQVRRTIRRVFSAFERDRLNMIREAITTAASRGDGLTPSVARALFGRRGARRAITPTISVAPRVVDRHVGPELTGVSLRSRLRRRTSALTDRMAEQVSEAVRLGESTRALSQRVLSARDIEVRIPTYVERVRRAAKTAPPSAMRSMVRRQLGRLGELTNQPQDIRRETERFLRRIERTEGVDIDQAIETWVQGRAQNQAMTIARTEGQLALNEAYVESTRGQDWVVGYRWNLSPSHRVPDICDVMANQDLHGLGPGGYPKDDVPSLAHPNDLCFFTAITDELFLDRELARRRGDPEPPRPWVTEGGVSGRDWLARQSAGLRRDILGPGRAAEFRRRPTKVVNADGSFNPLYTIQGRPAPPLPRGERFVHRANGDVGRLGERRNDRS